MKRYNFIPLKIYIILVLVFFLSACVDQKKKNDNSIAIFGALATMIPINEISDSFNLTNTIHIDRNYSASGNLARQIANGAKADIFISADIEWIDYLKNKSILIDTSIFKLAQNKLVIICHKNKAVNIDFTHEFDIKSIIQDKIAIGDPLYVPAGKYAKQVFDSLGWYDKIQDKIVLTKDVSSVLHLVELDECDWGIVYYSEAIKSNDVNIVAYVPEQLHNPISFYMVLIKGFNSESKLLFDYLKQQQATKILTKHGFITER